jgi:hypothetical protein
LFDVLRVGTGIKEYVKVESVSKMRRSNGEER